VARAFDESSPEAIDRNPARRPSGGLDRKAYADTYTWPGPPSCGGRFASLWSAPTGNFVRQFTLPTEVEAEKVQAEVFPPAAATTW